MTQITQPRAARVEPAREGVWQRMAYEYAGGAVNALTALFVLYMLVQTLSVEAFGLYQVALNVTMYGVLILNLGLPPVVSRYMPEQMLRGDGRAVRALLLGAIAVSGLAGLAVGGGAYLCRGALGRWLQQPQLGPLMGALWCWMITRVLVQLLESAADALRGQLAKNRVSVIVSLAQLGILLIVFRQPVRLPVLLSCFIAADAALVMSYGWIVWRLAGGAAAQSPPAPARPLLRRSVLFGAKEYGSILLSSLWDVRVDLFLVSAMLGIGAAGIFGFAVAVTASLLAWSPGTFLRHVTRPLFVEAYLHQGQAEEGQPLQQLFSWYLVVSALLAAPLFLGAMALFVPVVRLLFRPEYLEAAPLITLIGMGMLIRLGMDPLRNILMVTERVGVFTMLNALACTKLLASYLAIRAWGMPGAAAVYSLYTAAMVMGMIWWTKRCAALSWPWQPLARVAVNAAAMVAVLLVGRLAAPTPGWVFGVAAAGILAYAVMTLLNPPFPIQPGPWRERSRALLGAIRACGSGQESAVC